MSWWVGLGRVKVNHCQLCITQCIAVFRACSTRSCGMGVKRGAELGGDGGGAKMAAKDFYKTEQ